MKRLSFNKGKALFLYFACYQIDYKKHCKIQPINSPHKTISQTKKHLVQLIPTPLAKFRINNSTQLPYNQFVSDNKRRVRVAFK